MSGGVATLYAASYPTRGAVIVESPGDLRPFATLVRQLAPALRGPGFADAFAIFQNSMGLDSLPEEFWTAALDAHAVRQEIVLGYWDELLRTDPDALQARVEEIGRRIDVPLLAVFGHELAPGERDYLRRLVPQVQLVEWADRGHFVHLADPDRFTARLRAFVDYCAAP